jgi:CsoR family transcriptional regulator, copper-sensing transcriptional repressor
MKSNEQLINNIIGQLNGIKRMINEDKDCLSIMTQLKAAKSAFDSLTSKYLKENLDKCIKSKGRPVNSAVMEKLINEIIKG